MELDSIKEYIHKLAVEGKSDEIIKSFIFEEKVKHFWQINDALMDSFNLIGNSAVSPLITALKEFYNRYYESAHYAIKEYYETGKVTYLENVLYDKDLHIRKLIFNSLVRIGSESINLLIKSLDDANPYIRKMAVRALGSINNTQAVEPMIKKLEDPDWLVRITAVRELGFLQDKRALEHLKSALNDPEREIRLEVIEAIKKINWFRIHDRHMENREVEVVDREIAGYVFLKIGCSAIEPIIASINNSNNSEFRKYAIQALSYFRDERIVDTLIDRMKDPDVFTGVVAAYALKNFPNKKVIDALISTFSYNSGNVIDEVCKTLEFIGEPAIDSLIAALDDERYKRYCIRVITAIRGSSDQTNEVNSSLNIKPQKRIEQENQIIPQLIKSIKRSNPNYREEAAISLVKLADSSINLLLSYLDVPDPFVQTAVMMALAKLANPETIEPLINKMRDNNWKIRSLAAFVLSRIGNPSVKRLIESLNDSDWKVRSGAADALGYMHDKQALEPLSKLCTDSDLYVRISAVNAKKIIESYLKSESDEYTRN